MNMNNCLRNGAMGIALMGVMATGFGQIQYPGTPSWTQLELRDIPFETFPEIDREALAAEDAVTDAYKTAAWRFGVDHEVNISPETHGLWTTEGGERVWRLGVECPDALAVSFLFDAYRLPKGARLFFWNAERTDVRGAFDHRNNKEWGSLAIGQTAGDRIVIEYHEPLEPAFEGELHISQVIHAYRSLLRHAEALADAERGPYGNSGDCNINVNCPEGATWATEKKSVALIIEGNFAVCTGALVNNTLQDGTPYFLTANHCLGNPNNWTYLFNHESASCAGSNGPTTDEISGGTLLANNSGSDVALIELSSTPPASYNVQYAGWDASGTPPSAVTGIHHPSGDVKKICFDEDGPTTANQGGAAVWYINQWEDGVTEPGSSGSPLFDQNHRIVGQLYGGFAACSGSVNNGQADWYGRFDVSWDAGSSPSNELVDWLDPTGSGITVMDGWPEGSVSFDTDAGIAVNGLPEQVLCGENSISPTVTVTNMGVNNLTSATILYSLNGGAQQQVNWSGNLAQYESDGVTLPTLTVVGGTNELVVEVTSPNGMADENGLNNTIVSEIAAFEGPTFDFQLALVLDDYGSETTWTLRRLGTVVYEGGPYSDGQDGTEILIDLCLEEGCYVLRVEDSYGDGMCCDYGEGSWAILGPQGETIAEGGEFTDVEQESFCTDEMGISSLENWNSLKVFPNPAHDAVQIQWLSPRALAGTLQVRDLSGRLLKSQRWAAGQTDLTLPTSELPAGTYFVSMLTDTGVTSTRRISVIH
jgi:V8-like Glu-specific endopeptidase